MVVRRITAQAAVYATRIGAVIVAAVPWLLASYLVGAIPTSYLVGRTLGGLDLRQHGSQNLGATNLYRVLGWRYAIPVGLFDASKGVVPVLVFAPRISDAPLVAFLCGVFAIIGHVFSVFVRFRGGKGVATAAGVVAALHPLALVGCALVWVAVVYLSGYVSLGSILAASLLPAFVVLTSPGTATEMIVIDTALALAIIWFHRANIRRLLRGTEHRFGRRATAGRRS